MECKFSIPKKNKKAIWEITSQCNYLCKYCIFASNANKDYNELSLEECKHVIDELEKNKFYTLKITGGEPFLRKDLLDIITYAKEKKMHVDVSTNASLINDSIAASLKKTNIDMIHVSLDGHNIITQEYIRGENTFNRTIKGIKKLKANGLYVRIGTVLYKNNENNIEDIIKFVIELKADEIIFSVMEPIGRLNGDYTDYKTKTNDDLKKELDYLKEKYQSDILINYNWDESRLTHVKTCPAGKKFIFINNLGNVTPCTWISNFQVKYNLKTNSLKSILASYDII
jgi:MoaA/NifB/PqqE/SkfB family radical SAM enzyme